MSKKKILYGIQVTGSGHFSRSREIINELKNQGFEVDILVSGDSWEKDFGTDIKHRFKGLTFDPNHGLSIWQLIKQNNVIQFFKDAYHLNLNNYDLVITDFEPITSWAAKIKRKNIIGIGNHYKFFEWTWTFELFFLLNKITCHIISPVSEYIGFDYLRSNGKIFNPVIRADLKGVDSVSLGHYISYLHNYSWGEQVEFYKQFKDQKFIIYSSSIEKNFEFENCKIKKLDNDEFKNDLLKCSGVVCNAGFQTTSECLFLGKKIFVIPIKRQIEQKYNKNVLKNLGFYYDKKLNEKSFKRFLESNYFMKINYTNSIDKIIFKINSML